MKAGVAQVVADQGAVVLGALCDADLIAVVREVAKDKWRLLFASIAQQTNMISLSLASRVVLAHVCAVVEVVCVLDGLDHVWVNGRRGAEDEWANVAVKAFARFDPRARVVPRVGRGSRDGQGQEDAKRLAHDVVRSTQNMTENVIT